MFGHLAKTLTVGSFNSFVLGLNSAALNVSLDEYNNPVDIILKRIAVGNVRNLSKRICI